MYSTFVEVNWLNVLLIIESMIKSVMSFMIFTVIRLMLMLGSMSIVMISVAIRFLVSVMGRSSGTMLRIMLFNNRFNLMMTSLFMGRYLSGVLMGHNRVNLFMMGNLVSIVASIMMCWAMFMSLMNWLVLDLHWFVLNVGWLMFNMHWLMFNMDRFMLNMDRLMLDMDRFVCSMDGLLLNMDGLLLIESFIMVNRLMNDSVMINS